MIVEAVAQAQVVNVRLLVEAAAGAARSADEAMAMRTVSAMAHHVEPAADNGVWWAEDVGKRRRLYANVCYILMKWFLSYLLCLSFELCKVELFWRSSI